ncbi:MAG: LysE family transporter [SAR324 cluster bacterium]|nr:LysE family transporter [SAR324 cluster bacterium]
MIGFLTTGVLLGLSAGWAPGPLLALVIAETLQHGLKAGVKVALSPVLTDLPIIIFTLFMLAALSQFQTILGCISLMGGVFVLYLCYGSIQATGIDMHANDFQAQSLKKGVLVNVLSPHPYLFWFSVGAPTTAKAMEQSVMSVLAFIGSFYVFLVGSKIVLAILVSQSQPFLTGRFYVYTMRCLSVLLCIFSLFLFYDGFKRMGWIFHGLE